MTFEERAAVKLLIDSAVRVSKNVVYDTRIHGVEQTYTRGCRCDECRKAATDARRKRRRIQVQQQTEIVCRENRTSYELGCRCWSCREAKAIAARKTRNRKREAA